LLRQAVATARALAFPKVGRSIEARIAMIEITTRSSINVKAPGDAGAMASPWNLALCRGGVLTCPQRIAQAGKAPAKPL